MDKPSQIVIDTLLGKIKEKEAERNAYALKTKLTQAEIDDLYKALNREQGRERNVRSDKGKKRLKGNTSDSPTAKTLSKPGRVKQTGVLTKFDKDATFEQKIVFALTSANRVLHNREIADIIYQYDKSVSTDVIVERISARINRYKKEGTIKSFMIDGNIRNTVYGLPSFFNEDGSIKKGYEYSGKYLVGNRIPSLGTPLFLLMQNQ